MRRRTGVAMRLDDPQWLRRRYVDEGASIGQMARECGVSWNPVRTALVRAGIEIRPNSRWVHPLLADEAWLRRSYIDRGRTISAIAEELRVDDRRVVRALDAAGIQRRPPNPRQPPVTAPELHDELWLRRAYVKEGRTLRSIGTELGCSTKPVWKAMRTFGIQR
jgi:hypothetical protein